MLGIACALRDTIGAVMRVLVCDGRDYRDRDALNRALDRLRPERLIHGGAPGADSLAAEWARSAGVPESLFPANWATDDRSASPLRNQRMLDEGKPDVVLVCPGGDGTADMARRARDAGVEVIEIR